MALFDGLIEEIVNYLQTSSVLSDMDFTAEYPLNTKPHPLKRIHVSIGLRSVKAENAHHILDNLILFFLYFCHCYLE